tara:strand:- start:1401 stop:1577 length:177 start_codon:yes stop_codon:yes gene_type:complete
MNNLMEEMWVAASAAVVDETLVAHKGRKNPHHVLIMDRGCAAVRYIQKFFNQVIFCWK